MQLLILDISLCLVVSTLDSCLLKSLFYFGHIIAVRKIYFRHIVAVTALWLSLGIYYMIKKNSKTENRKTIKQKNSKT